MDTAERNEVREMLQTVVMRYHAENEAMYAIVNAKLDGIKKETSKTSGRVNTLEKDVHNMQLTQVVHEVKCPSSQRFEKLEEYVSKNTSIKKFIIATVGTIGISLGVIYTIIQIIEFF